MGEWRYAMVGCGAPCVKIGGTIEMLKWFVDSYTMMAVS